MQLLIIRHAPAGDREAWARETGEPDERRPITDAGRRKMRRAARGLHALVPSITLLGTSPLVRAAQTAELVRDACDGAEPVTVGALAPERAPAEFARWLRDVDPAEGDVIAAVGHEPHLGALVGWFLAERVHPPVVALKKGGACLLAFDGPVGPGRGRLEWLLTPRQLRAVAGA